MTTAEHSEKKPGKGAPRFALALFLALSLGAPVKAEKTVVFPDKGTPVGNALTYSPTGKAPLKLIGPARGKIVIKDDLALYLIATPEGMGSFSTLLNLKPGALQRLRLHDVPIGKNDLQTLGKLTALTDLDLSFSDVNDSAFEFLSTMKGLRCLDLSSTLVRGLTMNKLKSLKQLVELDLADTRIHDFAVSTIVESCPQLQKLDLTGTYITDSAVVKLQNLRHLQRLKLSKNNITDRSIDKLLALKELKKLSLSGTHVTAGKLRSMREARPDCKFVFKQSAED